MTRTALGMLVLATVAGCGDGGCPEGFAEVEGRCLGADSSVLLDASTGPDGSPSSDLDARNIDVDGGSMDACSPSTFFVDSDADGHGDASRSLGEHCVAPEGSAMLADDCDDARGARHPGASELCNGEDEDCDERIDEGLQTTLGAPVVLASEGSVSFDEAFDVVAQDGAFFVAYARSGSVACRGEILMRVPDTGAIETDPAPATCSDAPGMLGSTLLRLGHDASSLYMLENRAEGSASTLRMRRSGLLDISWSPSFGVLRAAPAMVFETADLAVAERLLFVWVAEDRVYARSSRLDLSDLEPVPTSVVPALASELDLAEVGDGTLVLASSSQRAGDTLVNTYVDRLALAPIRNVGVPVRLSDGHSSAMGSVGSDGAGRLAAAIAYDDGTVEQVSLSVVGLDSSPIIASRSVVMSGSTGAAFAPATAVSTAGQDVVAVLGGGLGARVLWSHTDDAGTTSTVMLDDAPLVSRVRVARTSARSGLVVWDHGAGATRSLRAQRIGCE